MFVKQALALPGSAKQRTTGNYCHGCYFCGCGSGVVVASGALLVGGGSFFWGDWGVFALVLDLREVLLTSPLELAHCGGESNKQRSSRAFIIYIFF